MEDIFAIQDEIALEVVNALKLTLLDNSEERLARHFQPNLEAFEQLILGRYEMARRTAEGLSRAEQRFKRAIELDSNYALAYVELAETYGLQVWNGSLLFEESLQLRQPLIERALELDPLSGEAYAARAALRSSQQLKAPDGDFIGVEADVQRALELSPNSAQIHRIFSHRLSREGKLEEALIEIRKAADLDPMSPIIQAAVSGATWDVGRAEEALALLRSNIERNPEFPVNYGIMADYLEQLGELGKAQLWIREARRRNPEDSSTWFWECIGFLNLGDPETAMKPLRSWNPIPNACPVGPPISVSWRT